MKKKRFVGWIVLLMLTIACNKYDDGELWDKVNSLDDRVSSIEEQLKSLNSDITSIKKLADALQKNMYLTNIVMSNTGYTLTFSDGSQITISDGKDGVDGKDGKDGKDGADGKDGKDGADAPVISIKYYNDRYYWVQTINNETTWLTDDEGNMIPASGVDGKTPLLKVNDDDYWIISYDNGASYSLLFDENGNPIKATGEDGDSFFESFEVTEDGLRIVLKDGTEIIIPLGEEVSYNEIDLGLSVKWASFNLGATETTELGGLYLWGDVRNNENKPYYEAPNVDYISGTDYDIVRASWGGTWRMPTFAEVQELVTECEWTKGNLNGVNGMNVRGHNGETIFLPATGWLMIESLPDRQDIENGYYWAGESYVLDVNRLGYSLYFSMDGIDTNVIWNTDLFKLAIRPVKE